MGVKNPRACYRELGAELTRVRKAAGLSGDDIARAAGWSRTKISRMEYGQVDSTLTEVIHYLARCRMPLPEAKPIVDLARLAERKQDYWLSDKRIGGSLSSLIFHESAACRSISFDPLVVPGLLQTQGYAKAQISGADPGMAKAEIDAAVNTRMERQQVLYARTPSKFTFIIHEQALRVPVGGARVMQEQLLHLVLMSALERVCLRIVPIALGERSVFGGTFTLFKYEKYRPLLYLDQLRSGLFIEDRPDVADYNALVPRIEDVSLSGEQSRAYVAELADNYDRWNKWDGARYRMAAQPERAELSEVADRRPIYRA